MAATPPILGYYCTFCTITPGPIRKQTSMKGFIFLADNPPGSTEIVIQYSVTNPPRCISVNRADVKFGEFKFPVLGVSEKPCLIYISAVVIEKELMGEPTAEEQQGIFYSSSSE